MSDGLRGRVAVITGGATGIGCAVARGLISRGAHVMIAGRNSERGYHVARSLAVVGRAMFERADVRCEQDVERLFQRTLQIYGRIDFLFNNAGSEGPHRSGEAVPGDYDLDELLGTNIKGVMLCLRHALPRLAACGGGVVVNTGSFVGTTLPFPGAVAYGATKAAVLSITRSVAASSKAQNVVVLAVCPWITDTPMADRLAGRDHAAKAEFARLNPSGTSYGQTKWRAWCWPCLQARLVSRAGRLSWSTAEPPCRRSRR